MEGLKKVWKGSVPNPSDRLIFVKVRAKDGHFFGQKYEQNSSFCDWWQFGDGWGSVVVQNLPSERKLVIGKVHKHTTTTLPHHTPPPIPKLSSITKTRILFVFLPKKVPVFCLYFYKNEPVWRIRHTAHSDFSLNPSIRQLLFDVEDGSFAASHKSSRRLLEFSHQFSGEIPAVPAAVSAGTSGISKITY